METIREGERGACSSYLGGNPQSVVVHYSLHRCRNNEIVVGAKCSTGVNQLQAREVRGHAPLGKFYFIREHI